MSEKEWKSSSKNLQVKTRCKNRVGILERTLNEFCDKSAVGNWIWERLKQYKMLSDDMAVEQQ